jgi:hypothetical protein
MGIIEKIKSAFGSTADSSAMPRSERPVEDTYLGTAQATTGVIPDVSTPADDPALRDVASRGVQPVSKPVEIEREQNPEAPRDNEVVRTK